MSLGRRRRTLERMPGYVVEPNFHHSCDIGADGQTGHMDEASLKS
jgi:hypothetical protein